ncbi:MAG: acetolactate synthase large subunit [Lautropia sp.]
MNGAESLVTTLAASGVDVCFANPGTSEMHFVAALDRWPGVRCVLGMFEGVVTGAADGYYRIARKPAATLLHLGPGFGNGLANLHNARKARSGIVNVVGDHAVAHARFDAPLHSDIDGIVRPVSHWVRRSLRARDVAADAADAVRATRFGASGRIATLILPADAAWNDAGDAGTASARDDDEGVDLPAFSSQGVDTIARQLEAAPADTLLLLGAGATSVRAQRLAGAIATRTGCRVMLEFYNASLPVGAGLPGFERIAYSVDASLAQLKGVRHLVLAGATNPVAFFAYPGKPSLIAPPGCAVSTLALPEEDAGAAIEALADALGVAPGAADTAAALPAAPSRGAGVGPDDWVLENIGRVIAELLPEDAIVVDESVSSGRHFAPHLRRAARHTLLQTMGGAIGYGLPGATGAAVAAGGRQVVALTGDGSAMYTLQSLWTMARESLQVAVIVFANRSYRILQGELAGVGATIGGDKARAMLSLDGPALDWLAIAKGHGVDARRATDLASLRKALGGAIAGRGPCLIEVVL